MATARLIPSDYALSNTQYLTIADASNMYDNTSDTSDYAVITHTRSSTNSTYYLYILGFNTSSIPSAAIVSSFTVKIRADATGHTTSTNNSYKMSLYHKSGTSYSSISSTYAESTLSTTTNTISFANGSLDWDTLSGYGSNFCIRVPLRRANSNTADVVHVYGAEIEVTYTVPDPRSITTTLNGSGTISPSGTTTAYDGDAFTLTITPTNKSDSVTATNNGTDITSSLVGHYTSGTTSSVSKTADSFTTGYSATNIAFYTSSSSQGNNFQYAVGHTAESPGSTSSGSGSWTYVKNPNSSSSVSSTGWADFEFDFSSIPSNAVIESVTVKCYGAIEDSSQSTSHADIQLYSGNTAKGTMQKFTSSTNSIITLSDPGTWTRTELQSAKLRFSVGYYGGHIFGITWTVTYMVPTGNPDYYTYDYTVNGDAIISVVIGTPTQTDFLYVKLNGSWVLVTKAYKKINGSYVQQVDLSTVFQSGVNYVKGN